MAGRGFFRRDGLLFRRYIPPGCGQEEEEARAIEQLVPPSQCREAVLCLAHSIPLAGHLGRNKTASRILQRFYWPTVFKDVAHYYACICIYIIHVHDRDYVVSWPCSSRIQCIHGHPRIIHCTCTHMTQTMLSHGCVVREYNVSMDIHGSYIVHVHT